MALSPMPHKNRSSIAAIAAHILLINLNVDPIPKVTSSTLHNNVALQSFDPFFLNYSERLIIIERYKETRGAGNTNRS